MSAPELPLGMHCPRCGEPPVAVLTGTQALCGTDQCPVLTWNPASTRAEFEAAAVPVAMTGEVTSDPEPPATALPMWTVYDNPADYPGKIVARESVVTAGGAQLTGSVVVVPHLALVREFLEVTLGLTPLGRQPEDDSVIVGVWV